VNKIFDLFHLLFVKVNNISRKKYTIRIVYKDINKILDVYKQFIEENKDFSINKTIFTG